MLKTLFDTFQLHTTITTLPIVFWKPEKEVCYMTIDSVVRFLRIMRMALLLLSLLMLSAMSISQPAAQLRDALPLSPNLPRERDLPGGQAHHYQLSLLAEQYIQIEVEQKGIDVVVTKLPAGFRYLNHQLART